VARTDGITELNPPRTWAVRSIGGSLTAIARSTNVRFDDGEGRILDRQLDVMDALAADERLAAAPLDEM
jgi:hypothetical protein